MWNGESIQSQMWNGESNQNQMWNGEASKTNCVMKKASKFENGNDIGIAKLVKKFDMYLDLMLME